MKKITRRSFLAAAGVSAAALALTACGGSSNLCCFHLYRSFFHRSFCCW
ncbi:MAG: twin-arginine translocation signal domain-containing protein [Faecalibacterium sp.]